ncbi:MAG: hypothetical protein NZ455_01695 [Bacteroidia bacterium]|nr:hypothetical protein [Bacteroidia bacterium]MDW8348449.1 hypothetical protein [Bacteroidia bacterium]
MGVSLRCAWVGVLRATLSLRCFAALRTGLTPTLRMPHAAAFECFTLFICIRLLYLV